jgi:hypothetical protein
MSRKGRTISHFERFRDGSDIDLKWRFLYHCQHEESKVQRSSRFRETWRRSEKR